MSDLIDRQAAIDAKMEFLNPYVLRRTEAETMRDRAYAEGWNACNSNWIDKIQALPSTQSERKKGYWIHISDDVDGNSWYECSCCHKGEVHVPIIEVSYCWNCGAEMRGEEDG